MKGRRGKELSGHSQRKKERGKLPEIGMLELKMPNKNEYEKQLMAIYLDTLSMVMGERIPAYVPDVPYEENPTQISIVTRLSIVMPKVNEGKDNASLLESIFYMLEHNEPPERPKSEDVDQVFNMIKNSNPEEEILIHNSEGGMILERVPSDQLEKCENKPEK